MNISTKIKLHQHCSSLVEQQVNAIQKVLQETQQAANNETKSSAGDKHETGRAMAQLETEKLTNQLSEALKTTTILARVNSSVNYERGALGSLIKTNNGTFYLAVSLGKVTLEKIDYFVISTASPIGKLLLGKKSNDSFSFNSKAYLIEAIF